MRSGLLNERLSVYGMTTTTDATGAQVVTLTLKGTYFCRVLTARNDRDTDRRFELRRQIAIADSDIIEYDGLKYVIGTIERNRNLDIQTLNCIRYEQ